LNQKNSNKAVLWPEYPKVLVKKDQIYILFIDGKKMRWGRENKEDIITVAEDIENGLKAIHFFTNCLTQSINDSCDFIKGKGYTDLQIKEYLNDAIRNIAAKGDYLVPEPDIESEIPFYIK
jgi:hypothetical protein